MRSNSRDTEIHSIDLNFYGIIPSSIVQGHLPVKIISSRGKRRIRFTGVINFAESQPLSKLEGPAAAKLSRIRVNPGPTRLVNGVTRCHTPEADIIVPGFVRNCGRAKFVLRIIQNAPTNFSYLRSQAVNSRRRF